MFLAKAGGSVLVQVSHVPLESSSLSDRIFMRTYQAIVRCHCPLLILHY